MKRDTSLILYKRYTQSKNHWVEINLRNGRRFSGMIISFCNGIPEYGDAFITRWRISLGNDILNAGRDSLGFTRGIIIDHPEISEIKFLEDGSVMVFH